ncbi:putative quinol monooxygenase [Yinghuangia seranimata]|uniref:putative quinol monooxygenase n=1 Tax=Yinghuangia seranimata TaxID=408067 RepID=UPI00248AC7FF|nr:putative quinol monooxygenase [Yinghuangia seranimata]MDI2130758.1 putative quinol monooxygenase [Yinghuangia seranimata]
MSVVTAVLRARPECADILGATLREVAESTRAEAGLVGYTVVRLPDDVFVLSERYADVAAREAHMASPYVARLLAQFPELLAENPGVEFGTEAVEFVDFRK